ncbi:MAG: GntR family transcriptional regulator [Chloroflexi bacterium]|nr:GntR family transcriptional regulator [Chloroflexota bacterium]
MTSETAVLDEVAASIAVRAAGLRDEVVGAIERAVSIGAIAPGQRLVEAEIARQMGISKAPVREALRELERLGLVVSYPRRGTFVTEITPLVVSEAFSLRAALEVYAGRLAIQHWTESDLQQMEALLEEADATLHDQHAILQRVELDLSFHDHLFRLSRHKLLQEAWTNLRAKIRVLLAATGVLRVSAAVPKQPLSYRRGHAALLEALRSRDRDRLEAETIHHLAAGEQMLLEHLADDRDGGRPDVAALATWSASRLALPTDLDHSPSGVVAPNGRSSTVVSDAARNGPGRTRATRRHS